MSSTYKTKIRIRETTRGWGEAKQVIPAKVVDLQVTIDWDRLFQQLGEKAAASKGKKSAALAGIIKVKAVREVELA